ncbi:hypothetical protein GCM10028784_06380 [Myceligenerans cantabricum]
MTDSLKTRDEVDLDEVVVSGAPRGWMTSRDIMENFLLAGALEMQARTRIFPSNPFVHGLEQELPPAFRYDTLGALLRYGPYVENELRQPAFSLNPEVNYAYFEPMFSGPERIGRLSLLGIVWEFVDVALERTGNLRPQGFVGFEKAINDLGRANLGKHGLSIFMAAFYREFIGDPRPPYLSPVESAFIDGESIPGYANGGFGPAFGAGSLSPSGAMYLDSIWTTVWTILTMRAPEHFVSKFSDRRDSLMDVLDRGARIAAVSGTNKCWPGWSS